MTQTFIISRSKEYEEYWFAKIACESSIGVMWRYYG